MTAFKHGRLHKVCKEAPHMEKIGLTYGDYYRENSSHMEKKGPQMERKNAPHGDTDLSHGERVSLGE